MSYKKYIILGLLLLGLALALAACASGTPATPCPDCPPPPEPEPCPTSAPCPDCPTCPAPVVENVPFQEMWVNSPHNTTDAEAFIHWNEDDPAEVPTSCATCHTTAGYQDFLGADGSEAGVVDAAVPAPAGTIQCVACHNEATAALTSVKFPYTAQDEEGNDVQAEVTGLGSAARCMVCHQGRASKSSVDGQIARFEVTDMDAVVEPIQDGENTVSFGFINIHYFAAAATLYGTEVKGGYEYDGKMYDAKHDHVPGYDSCVGCHNPHTLEVKVDQCAFCHTGVTGVEDLKNVREASSLKDYDGDGDMTEGMFYEVEGLQEMLYQAIQAYATDVSGKGIVYDPAAHPYFFVDDDGDGTADQGENGNLRYDAFTARLLKAAYNYQVSKKDPGAFAHGNKYIVELLYDSIEDLNTALATPIDLSTAHRDDAGHFAGNTEPFRHWDAEGGVVPGSCAKCHSAAGLPQFLAEGTTISNPASNGFQCSTCHDEANWPNRYVVDEVTFPSGATLTFGEGVDSNLCLVCHQGRSSGPTLDRAVAGKDADTPDETIRFTNVHYFAAGATLFGTEAKGAYEFEGQTYVGAFTQHPLNKCQDCHDVHALEIKIDACAACHAGASDPRDPATYRIDPTDWDGDGDTTEGVKGEVDGFVERLYAAMQAYAVDKGTPLLYDAHAYPYFFVDADQDGVADVGERGPTGYNAWTPTLLKAAYNYQYYQKDPGAFTHNAKYVMQFLYDSITAVGGDTAGLTRP